jgi:hypothetical protein
MADRLGGVPVTAKVNAFQGEVGGDQCFVTGGETEYGAVVADTGHNTASFRRQAADVGDQGAFCKRHGGIQYTRKALYGSPGRWPPGALS